MHQYRIRYKGWFIMGTKMPIIYDTFLSKISDYKFLNMEKIVVEEELLRYFKSARAKFYKCKKDLNFLNESNPIELKDELTFYEQEIIVKLMLVEYLTPLIMSSEILKQSLSDKDFKIYSQANHLKELGLLYRQIQREANKMITEYSYMGMTGYEG